MRFNTTSVRDSKDNKEVYKLEEIILKGMVETGFRFSKDWRQQEEGSMASFYEGFSTVQLNIVADDIKEGLDRWDRLSRKV